MAKLETSGFKRYWPLKELMGHDSNGNRVTREVFRDIETGEIFVPMAKDGTYQGWSGEPTGAKPDQPTHSASDTYRQNYELIRWETCRGR